MDTDFLGAVGTHKCWLRDIYALFFDQLWNILLKLLCLITDSVNYTDTDFPATLHICTIQSQSYKLFLSFPSRYTLCHILLIFYLTITHELGACPVQEAFTLHTKTIFPYFLSFSTYFIINSLCSNSRPHELSLLKILSDNGASVHMCVLW